MGLTLNRPQAMVYVPDGVDLEAALARTTHLGIGAHADDLEFMAWHPIVTCHDRADAWFTAVTVSDGRGSPRNGAFADLSDDDMRAVRLEEQREAARLGGYGVLLCLDHPSAAIRDPADAAVRGDLQRILSACGAREVYTHNPADKHDTHAAVACRAIEALRAHHSKPERFFGCEVWRGLDWLPEPRKTTFDVSQGVDLMRRLMAVYVSQIDGGKRYDLATVGRKHANATYLSSHAVDVASAMEYFLDMTPLLENPDRPIAAFMRAIIEELAQEIDARLERFSWK